MSTVAFEDFDVMDLEIVIIRWTKWKYNIEKYLKRQSIPNDAKKVLELFMHGGYDLEQL